MISTRPADAADDLLGRFIHESPFGGFVAIYRQRNPLPGYGVEPYYDYLRRFSTRQAALDWLVRKTGGSTLFEMDEP